MSKKAKSKKPRAKKAKKSATKSKKRSASSVGIVPARATSPQNGVATNGHAVHAPAEDDHVLTVTFRIPASLKRNVEDTAKGRGMTTTRLVVEALSNEVGDRPPRWFSNWQLSRDRVAPTLKK